MQMRARLTGATLLGPPVPHQGCPGGSPARVPPREASGTDRGCHRRWSNGSGHRRHFHPYLEGPEVPPDVIRRVVGVAICHPMRTLRPMPSVPCPAWRGQLLLKLELPSLPAPGLPEGMALGQGPPAWPQVGLRASRAAYPCPVQPEGQAGVSWLHGKPGRAGLRRGTGHPA